ARRWGGWAAKWRSTSRGCWFGRPSCIPATIGTRFCKDHREVPMSAIRHIHDIPGYPAPHSPYSHAVVANGFVFVSGQIPVRPGGGPTEVVGTTMQEQTRQGLRNVKLILEAAGSSLDRVVKVTVLLARPELYREMNEAYAEFFPGPKPARAMARF